MSITIRLGDEGRDVTALKATLAAAGYSVDDGDVFTNTTLAAVCRFQADHNLMADGIVGRKTFAAIARADTSKLLGTSHIESAAQSLGCDAAAIMAVIMVESRGFGFFDNGQPAILFERHWMRRRMLANGVDASTVGLAEFRWPELVNRQSGGYEGGPAEHRRLRMACEIHETSALESASWGQFQIMGFHWHRLGFASVKQMVAACSISEGVQLEMFVRFIETDSGNLRAALVNRDWPVFAYGYNGPAYHHNRYDQKLHSAYTSAQQAIAARQETSHA